MFGRHASLDQARGYGVNLPPSFGPRDLSPGIALTLREKDIVRLFRGPPLQIFAETPRIRAQRFRRADDESAVRAAFDIHSWRKEFDRNEIRRGFHIM